MAYIEPGPEELPEEALLTSAEFCMYSYKILPCRKRYGHVWSDCVFAHVGEKVARRCPRQSTYTALMCPDLKKGGECPRREACCFAHNSFEYWLHPTRYKTEFCAHGARCTRRVCFFAHSEAELRPSSNDLRARLPQMISSYMKTMPSAASPVPEPTSMPAGWYLQDMMTEAAQVQAWAKSESPISAANFSSPSPRPWMANYKQSMATAHMVGSYAAPAPSTRQMPSNWPAPTLAAPGVTPYYYQTSSQPQYQNSVPVTAHAPSSKLHLEPNNNMTTDYLVSRAVPTSQAMLFTAPRAVNTMPTSTSSFMAEAHQASNQQSPLHSDHSGSEDLPLAYTGQYHPIHNYQEYCQQANGILDKSNTNHLLMGMDSHHYPVSSPSSRAVLRMSVPMQA